MVEISYKAPFLEMLKSVTKNLGIGNLGARMEYGIYFELLTEIADDVQIDAENCDTPTNVLTSISNVARGAARTLVDRNLGFAARTRLRDRSDRDIDQIIGMFENIDDDDIDCEVEESSPLAKFRHGKLSN